MLLGLATALGALTGSPESTQSACTFVCGDYNCEGQLSSADIFEITRFLYQGGGFCFVPGEETCANPDGHEVITVRDVVFITRTVFGTPIIDQCDTLAPALPIDPSDDFWLLHETRFPAGDSVFSMNVDLVHYRPVTGATIVFLLKVDGQPATLLQPLTEVYPPGFIGKGSLSGQPTAPWSGVFGFATGLELLPPSRRPLLQNLKVHAPASPFDRTITLELINYDSLHVDPRARRNSTVSDDHYEMWTYGIGPPACPFRLTGDGDMSGALTSSDIIVLVNYVFKSGSIPFPCAPAGDVNCDLVVSSSDIIHLVNHVFKSGPAPCDACMVYSNPWGCF